MLPIWNGHLLLMQRNAKKLQFKFRTRTCQLKVACFPCKSIVYSLSIHLLRESVMFQDEFILPEDFTSQCPLLINN